MTSDAGDQRTRLLVLTSTFPRWPGDHEPPFVFELARRLTQSFAVTVLAPHAHGAQTQEIMDGVAVRRFRYAPAKLERLAYSGGIPSKLHRHPWLMLLVPAFLLAQLWATCVLLRRQQPAAVHAHWLITGGLVAAVARRLCGTRCRLIVTAHGADVYGFDQPVLRRLKRWLLSEADVVTVVSEALWERIQALGAQPGRIVVQGMGTDLQSLFVPRSAIPTRPTIVYAGRLVPKKGIDLLLRAAALLLPQIPELRLVIAGHGPEQAALEHLSDQLGIRAAVDMAGPYQLADLPWIYAQASVGVFPFRQADSGDQDGLGLAVIEAMGCQVPVVCTDLPALGDLMEHGVTGLVARPEDPAALAECIRVSLQDPTAAAARAAVARQRVVQRYDWLVVAARYAALLQSAGSSASAPHNQAGS